MLQEGKQIEPDGNEEVQLPTLPWLGACDASQSGTGGESELLFVPADDSRVYMAECTWALYHSMALIPLLNLY